MLFALRQPAVLLGLVLGFAVGIAARTVAVRVLLRRPGPLAGMRQPISWLDPFGAVAAVLTGVGWGVRPEVDARRRGQLVVPLVTSVVVHAALAAAGLALYVAAGGALDLLPLLSTVSVLHGTEGLTDVTSQQVALGFAVENLACGLLSLVPIPPVESGVLAWTVLPTSPGARRAAYHVLEEQWGVAVLLVLLLLPLAGEQPLLLELVGSVGDAVLHAL